MNEALKEKLKSLPLSSGVYFHKNKAGEVIYVGKAAVLKNRVRQYFQNTRDFDAKTKALVDEIFDTDWIETESEIDALFFESEMVKRYMPRYNILLRDDKSQSYVRIDTKSEWPHVSFTRNPSDDEAEYFGPFYNGYALKKALRYLRKTFPYYTQAPKLGDRPSLNAHLGLEPLNMTSEQYHGELRKLISYIKGNRTQLAGQLEKEMKQAAKAQDFEQAAILRNRLHNLKELRRRIMFGDREFLDISKDKALSDLVDLLGLSKVPAHIEGFDISHMSGTNVVASQVVFMNGVSSRADYRKYKTKIDQNNDFYNINETITRRLSDKNLKSWGKPDLILIDGGKGQLDAALSARDSREVDIPFIGLAKRDEQIVIDSVRSNVVLNEAKLKEMDGFKTASANFILVNLPKSSHIVKLLQRVRDESHRFAVSYHTVLKRQKQTASLLDDIPGIGPVTKKKLLKAFGSLKGISGATDEELEILVGEKLKTKIRLYIDSSPTT